MKKRSDIQADPEDLSTWRKYKKSLCSGCNASCCGLPVEVKAVDLIRIGLMDEFELEDNLKLVAKRLKKDGVVEHFHSKTETFTLSRFANGDCLYLDQKLRRCRIYQRRPDTCRNHPAVGPRPGYCAFSKKNVV